MRHRYMVDLPAVPRVLAIGSLIAFVSAEAFGQSSIAPPAFEVASIKQNKSGSRRSGVHADPGKISGTNSSLKQLISYAYNLPSYQISGTSAIEDERFDVIAKSEGSPSTEQLRLMLQTLLTDRFRFKSHREAKNLSIYMLVVADNGPKLPVDKEGDALLQKGPPPPRPGSMFLFQRSEMSGLGEGLSRILGRPVLDRTGIKGRYVFYLEWAADPVQPGGGGGADLSPGPSEPPSGGSLFTALQEKLGLKLESGKASVEVLVIDHAEKPSEN